MTPDAPSPTGQPGGPTRASVQFHEVRYSMPELLEELAQERNASSFSMEKMHQAEINKMFSNKRKTRAKKA